MWKRDALRRQDADAQHLVLVFRTASRLRGGWILPRSGRSNALFTRLVCALHHVSPLSASPALLSTGLAKPCSRRLAPPPLAALQLCLLPSLGCCVTVVSQTRVENPP